MAAPQADPALLRAALALVAEHGSISAASMAAGIPRPTLQNRIQAARMRGITLAAAPAPTDAEKRGERDGLPLAEDERKFHADWNAADCIRELRRIAEIDTRKVITRNYFRVYSDISESTWTRYFGTFEEFKRQAGIIVSRHVHRLEKDIAKHASVDKMRVLNGEKREFEGKYLRPSSGRWKSTVVLSDMHGLHCDPFYRRVALDLIERMQPEHIVLNGDIVDLAEFSKHSQDPRAFAVVEEIRWLHAFLRDLRRAAGSAQIDYIEGNHEFRLLRHMGEQTPAMMVMLADLHGFTISRLLGLDEFQVNYVARVDMTAWTERDVKAQLRKNYTLLHDNALCFGHFPEMRNMGIPGASGHHHAHVVWNFYSPVHGPAEWHQIGCGHQREASYCRGEKWGNGFLVAHTDTASKRSQFEYFDLSHQAAFVGGKFYERTEAESVLDMHRAMGRAA